MDESYLYQSNLIGHMMMYTALFVIKIHCQNECQCGSKSNCLTMHIYILHLGFKTYCKTTDASFSETYFKKEYE